MKTFLTALAFPLLLLAFLTSSCAKQEEAPAAANESSRLALPSEWYRLPEDADAVPDDSNDPEIPTESAGQSFDHLLDAQQAALPQAQGASWHLAAFMTDLSVSTKGILGSLFMKGTPGISLIWRPHLAGAPRFEAPAGKEAGGPVAVVSLSGDSGQDLLAQQLEASVRAAMATGRIRNETRLREELARSLGEFAGMVRGLETNPGREWWVSRVRVDLSADASGKVGWFTSLGADVQLRFEWFRIKSKTPRPANRLLAGQSPSKLQPLVDAVASDLGILSGTGGSPRGFQAYSFRVGIGVTAGGTFGLVKGNTTAIGHVHFSRDVAKPGSAHLMSELATGGDEGDDGAIPLIEESPLQEHLAFARGNAIPYAREVNDGALEQVVYRISHKQFRKGLRKAAGIGRFFANRASRIHVGRWGLYEMRTSFDLSVGGKFGIATVAGLAATEINFYNEEF
jgi:hypothetical protein